MIDKSTLASRIMVALDVDELSEAQTIAEDLKGLGVTFKIGNQLGTYEGWHKVIDFANQYGAQVFCDTKFKDIPNTVEKSSRAITRHQPQFFNVMADNNLDTLKAAVKGLNSAYDDYNLSAKPKILGVTVLTSISNEEAELIYGASASAKVLQFAKLAAKAGLDGVVCSTKEVSMLKQDTDTKHLLLITPGIRPAWADANDQARVMTPKEAIQAGVDYMVIGRPITSPPKSIGSPRQAVEKILEEIS